MDADLAPDVSVSVDDADTNRSELGSYKVDSVAGTSFNAEAYGELGSAGEALTIIELDLAFTSEKLYNLTILMMHMAAKESEFEVFDSEREEKIMFSLEKGLEYDLLSGFLDSEVKELDGFITTLQKQIDESHKWIPLSESLGRSSAELEEKLSDSEQTSEQLQEQVLELQAQSITFQKTLSRFIGEENRERETGTSFLENGDSLNVKTKIKIQSAEQQKHFLRMLEKSLARELDLEKKLAESRQTEEEMKRRLQLAEQEVYCLVEELFDSWERLFGADNSAEVLLGISRDLLGRLQISQFNMNGLIQREAELTSKASSLEMQLKENETVKVSEDVNRDQINAALRGMTDMENTIDDLREKLRIAESRAENAETNHKLLQDRNKELDEELDLLKSSGLTPEKVELLERQLRESALLLEQNVALSKASEEKQNMLYSTIRDMDNTIEELKVKVSKAEGRADSAEDKCIILSEINAELNEELRFLRGRMECLEGSLHQAEQTKLAAANNIGVRTKVIANLVMQLAMERERLNNQLASLAKENKILVVKLQQTSKGSTPPRSHDDAQKDSAFQHPVPSSERKCEEQAAKFLASSAEVDNKSKDPIAETEAEPADVTSELETVRRIDSGSLTYKHVFFAVLIAIVAALAYVLQQNSRS